MTADSKVSIVASAELGLDHDLRIHDLELAVLELANVVERLVVGGKNWKGEERQQMLTAVDNARALATPEDGDDDPEPEPASGALFGMPVVEVEDMPAGVAVIAPAGDTTSRYWIDLKNGGGYGTDELGDVKREVERGNARNVLDREASQFLVWLGDVVVPELRRLEAA